MLTGKKKSLYRSFDNVKKPTVKILLMLQKILI